MSVGPEDNVEDMLSLGQRMLENVERGVARWSRECVVKCVYLRPDIHRAVLKYLKSCNSPFINAHVTKYGRVVLIPDDDLNVCPFVVGLEK